MKEVKCDWCGNESGNKPFHEECLLDMRYMEKFLAETSPVQVEFQRNSTMYLEMKEDEK